MSIINTYSVCSMYFLSEYHILDFVQCQKPQFMPHSMLLYLSSTTKIILKEGSGNHFLSNPLFSICICREIERWQHKRRREGNANNFCLILAIKHALDSNLAKCLIIKVILGLDCITPGFYFYSVGSGRSLLSLTATVAWRSNFICLFHSCGLALSSAKHGGKPSVW